MSWNLGNRIEALAQEVQSITAGTVVNPLQSNLDANGYELLNVATIDGVNNEIVIKTGNANGILFNSSNLGEINNLTCSTLNYTTLNPPITNEEITLEKVLQNNNDGEQQGIINLKFINLGTTPSTYTTNTIDMNGGNLINGGEVVCDILNCQSAQFTNVNVAQNLQVSDYLILDNTIAGASQIHMKMDNLGSNMQIVGFSNNSLNMFQLQHYKGNTLYNTPISIEDNENITFKSDKLYITDGTNTGEIYDTFFNPVPSDITKTFNYFNLSQLTDSIILNQYKAYMFDPIEYPNSTKPNQTSYTGVYGLWSRIIQCQKGAKEANLKCSIAFTVNNALASPNPYSDSYTCYIVPIGASQNPVILSHTQQIQVYNIPNILTINNVIKLSNENDDGFYHGHQYLCHLDLKSVNYDQTTSTNGYKLIFCQTNINDYSSSYGVIINAIDGCIIYDNATVNQESISPQ